MTAELREGFEYCECGFPQAKDNPHKHSSQGELLDELAALTRSPKRVYEALCNWHEKNGWDKGVTAQKLHAFKPDLGNLKTFYNNLTKLGELGLTREEVEDVVDYEGKKRGSKPTSYFAKTQSLRSVDLPYWEGLNIPPVTEQSGLGGGLL